MSDLSKGWIEVKLPQVSELNLGQSPPSSTYNISGKGLPFFQGKAEFGNIYPTVKKYCSNPTKIAEPGDILLSVRAPVGPTNICMEKCGIGRGLAAIHSKGGIPNRYLFYYFRNIEKWLSAQGTGSTFTAISRNDLIDLDVLLAPLPEQKRIVAKLDQLLTKVEASKKRLDKFPKRLKRFRQSILAAACSGKLTEDWREKNKFEEWDKSTVVQIAERIQIGPFGTQLHKSDYVSNGIPLINPMHIKDYRIVADNEYSITKKKYAELKNYHLKTNDIIMARRGEMGRCALVTENENAWLCGTGSLFVRANRNVYPRFLFFVLSSAETKEFLEGESKGTTMNNLNLDILNRIPISLPSFTEQQEIVRRVEALFALADQLEARYKKAQSYVEKLTQSILAKAFRGKLVPQDPNDEPASLLLERIKQERDKEKVIPISKNKVRAKKDRIVLKKRKYGGQRNERSSD